jgi:hypothetical protein
MIISEYLNLKQDTELATDYLSIDPRIRFERRIHMEDSNKDAEADLETINMHILNAVTKDSGIYLCIVANSVKSFRVTYGFLNVKQDLMGNYTELFELNTQHRSLWVNWLLYESNHIIVGLVVASVLLAVFFFMMICQCYNHLLNMKNDKKSVDFGKNTKSFAKTENTSPMNNLLEKTMSSMKKVNI